MHANNRRDALTAYLSEAKAPVSAGTLAAHFGVSRQIIVGDIALLRAGGLSITATPRGYLLDVPPAPQDFARSIVCRHTADKIGEELYCIVDHGGAVLDVTVEHSVYGQLCAPLHISSRYEADLFLAKLGSAEAKPLCDLTDGVHLHRIRCRDEAAFARICEALLACGILVTENTPEP